MSKPTKKERHAIYKKALKEIESPDEFLCIIAWSVGGKKYGGIGQMPDLLPELGAQYKGRVYHNGGWFRTKADRRAALIRCIELSKPAKRK